MELTEAQARILIRAAHGLIRSSGKWEVGEQALWSHPCKCLKAGVGDMSGVAELTDVGRRMLAAYLEKTKEVCDQKSQNTERTALAQMGE